VSFAFPNAVGRGSEAILRDISFVVNRGELLCLVGESGCGKTTLLQIIAGLLKPKKGEINIHQHASDNGAVVPCTIVFQDLNLFYWQTALGNVKVSLRARGVPEPERTTLGLALLQKVNLSGFQDYYPHELSGGMSQRLALARALATNASILLLDEPFSDLDEKTRRALEEDLLRLRSETCLTVVMVTHDLRQAVRLGDRVVVLAGRPAQIQCMEKIELLRPRNEEEELFKTKEKLLCTHLTT
jgi:NitT/TauT family transport system ATP-binding protein